MVVESRAANHGASAADSIRCVDAKNHRCRARVPDRHRHHPDRCGAPTRARAARHGGRDGVAGRRRRRRGPAKRRQCRRCRGRDGLRHGGDAPVRGQSGRRRLHADPVRRWPIDVHRFPRDGAGQGLAQHVSRRQGRADERQHRRLAIVGRARHGARFPDGASKSTARDRGPRTWRRRSNWPRGSRFRTRSRSRSRDRARLARIRNRSASSRRTARSSTSARRWRSPSLPRRSSASRRTARTNSTKARRRSASPRRWRSTAASSPKPISRTTRRSSARR